MSTDEQAEKTSSQVLHELTEEDVEATLLHLEELGLVERMQEVVVRLEDSSESKSYVIGNAAFSKLVDTLAGWKFWPAETIYRVTRVVGGRYAGLEVILPSPDVSPYILDDVLLAFDETVAETCGELREVE